MKKFKQKNPFFRLFFLLFSFFLLFPASVRAESKTAEEYKRDYISQIYNSDDGLDGTAANCVFSSEDGFIWVGCYAGLYRYDGTEFKQYLINKTAMPVNDIIEDEEGNLWIGTNGDGLYCYDGMNFTETKLNSDDNGVDTIQRLFLDADGTVWVGTKAGLFSLDVQTGKVTEYEDFQEMEIRDIDQLSSGEMILIEKSGSLYLLEDGKAKSLTLSDWDEKSVPRCLAAAESGDFYIGTDGEEILKADKSGELEGSCSGDALYSFNQILEFEEGSYWVCSDAGIGLLQDGQLSTVDVQTTDSIESACIDYQGNYWFASSRMGVYQLRESDFSDMGAYWGRSEVINSIEKTEDGIYVGSDYGLFFYEGSQQKKNALTKLCSKGRIRQVYEDREKRIWAATYSSGIYIMDQEENIRQLNSENSPLTTDRIRSISEKRDGSFLIGTEEGAYLYTEEEGIKPLTEDEELQKRRILDVREGNEGSVYIATDGYGLYVLEEDGKLSCYTKEDGLFSGCVLKAVPSENIGGAWLVMGEGLCYISEDGYIQKVSELPTANCLDLLLTEKGEALVIASNGIFTLKETNLLAGENISYKQISKEDGICIDFTANARNDLEGDVLYICGTSGAMAIDFSKEKQELPIRIYLEGVSADGEELTMGEDSLVLPADAQRLTLSVRSINFVHRNISARYCLEGADAGEISSQDENVEENYTDLKGGNYTFTYKVIDNESKKTLAELSLKITKSYSFWEEPQTRSMLFFAVLMLILAGILLLVYLIERRVKQRYRKKLREMREKELTHLAYNDLATGAYSRNYYENEVDRIDSDEIYVGFSVSANYYSFYKMNQGLLFAEDMLRELVFTLQEHTKEEIKIFRISENVFFFWLRAPVQLESYIRELKEAFQELGDEKTTFSLAIGGSYKEDEESLRELMRRCEKMRRLDEKLAEAKFIEGKINSFQ